MADKHGATIEQVNPKYRVYRLCPLNGKPLPPAIMRATDFAEKYPRDFAVQLFAAHLLLVLNRNMERVTIYRGEKPGPQRKDDGRERSTYYVERAEEGDEIG